MPFVDSSGLSELLRAWAARQRGTAVAVVHGAGARPRIVAFRGVERLLALFATRGRARRLTSG